MTLVCFPPHNLGLPTSLDAPRHEPLWQASVLFLSAKRALTLASDALFWATTLSVDTTSAEIFSNIATIVHSPTKISVARGLQGDQAQHFVDLIDRVSDSDQLPQALQVLIVRKLLTSLPHPNEKLFRRCSRLLHKICKARGILPASCIVQPESIRVGDFERSGGFADVSKGEYQGRPIAIKQLRIRVGSKDEIDNVFKVGTRTRLDRYNRLFSTQGLCREILIWKHLSHPNVLPLFGVSVSKNPQHFRIITEWMPNGDVAEYISLNPGANRLRLVSPACISHSRGYAYVPPDRYPRRHLV